MTRLLTPALFGLLLLVSSGAMFATTVVPEVTSSIDHPALFDAFPLQQLVNPQKALEELCFDPSSFLVLVDPADSTSPSSADHPDLSGITPAQIRQFLDVGRVPSEPMPLALSGAGLILLGLIRRRKE